MGRKIERGGFATWRRTQRFAIQKRLVASWRAIYGDGPFLVAGEAHNWVSLYDVGGRLVHLGSDDHCLINKCFVRRAKSPEGA